ncbi:MAG TPA: proprotein convertase P-domain-containing protein [Thermoanaerobaculia bacterium]|nr:proprotein convertase P-domain-containing protein [Thermoanaerobaculia bacterium]
MRLALALLLALPLLAEQRLELVRHSLTGAHCRYREYVDNIPSDVYEVRPCSFMALSAAPAPVGPLRIIDGRIARREIVEERPLERYANDYDVETGALIRTVPLFFHAKPARIFDPNPVVALDDPTLQDRNDAASAVSDSAYRDVLLLDLVASGSLAGPHVKIVDRQSPSIAPADASSDLIFDREQDGFEDVQVYFHIDRVQRHLQSLGYTGDRGVAAYAIEADAHSANGADNSFFLPSATRFSEGTLHFGDGGTDDAEDADLIVHEYGHAIQEWISPGTFGGGFTSESRALAEGFGDYWAFSAHVAQRLASGRDPFCFADWDARCWEDESSQLCGYRAGSDCLRRLDSAKTMADFERTGGAGVEHRNGSIWSSALREIHQQLGRTVTDTIVIESLFDVPPSPTFEVMAQRMIEADRLLFNAAHVSTICATMFSRGILAGCDATLPRGELTLFQSSDHALPIPENNSAGVTSELTITDARAIEKLLLRVDIAHPLRGDLRIELVAPDGTVIVLQSVSGERGADVRTTFGPIEELHGRSAAGVWKLIVRDLRTRDAGTLLSWGLILQLAGDLPLSERPRGDFAQMIPVVAHVFGVNATRFASDVRIANASAERVTSTLIFTRSGHDGLTSFSAIDVALEAGQTVAFEDVVDSAFRTVGSGTLEVLGDVVVMSRTYAETAEGTLGQQVPPGLDVTATDARPLLVAPFGVRQPQLPLSYVRDAPVAYDSGSCGCRTPNSYRYNLGLAETSGAFGVVLVGTRTIEIAPFSHVQFPIEPDLTEIRVVSGNARVSAYLSQVDNTNGDAIFIPAESDSLVSRTLIAPVIHTAAWRSDLLLATPNPPQSVQLNDADVTIDRITTFELTDVTFGTVRALLPPGTIGGTRIRSDGASQFFPLLQPEGQSEQHLVFIESNSAYRTNIGIVSEEPALAEVIVYDAAGSELMRQTVSAQMPVTVPVTAGRAVVRFLSGSGRAYASLIDNRTRDATAIVYPSPRNARRIATAGAA